VARRVRVLAALAMGAAFVSAVVSALPEASASSMHPYAHYADPSCSEQRVTVSLGPTQPADEHVEAWLCGWTPGRTVQVTVSGTTYSHLYWDFPYQPATYSYVHAMVTAGYAVLNFDRIGIGLSDHPPALKSNGQANAWIVHELIGDIRAGRLGGVAFQKVLTVGHSQGSAITLLEEEKYHDADGLIVTGLPGVPDGPSAPLLVANLQPAQTDPQFAADDLPLGYLSTKAGVRGPVFYNLATADPSVIALDEQTKDVFPVGEATVLVSLAETLKVNVPVLSVTGENDGFFCAVACSVGPDQDVGLLPFPYRKITCLESIVVANTGHDVNLHPSAPTWEASAAQWVQRRIGNGPTEPPTDVCAGAASP
jgi:pimeloyl-ACP methyl ester carboxylesterase